MAKPKAYLEDQAREYGRRMANIMPPDVGYILIFFNVDGDLAVSLSTDCDPEEMRAAADELNRRASGT